MLPFLAGALIKLYDDLVDDNVILTNPYATTAILTLQVAVTTLVVANEFWLCVAFVLFNVVCAIARPSEYASPWAVSHILLAPVLLWVSWGSRSPFQMTDLPWSLAVLVGAGLEVNAFPEEFSWKKLAVRLLGSVFGLAAIQSGTLSSSLRTAVWIHVGYCMASSVFQALCLGNPRACHVEQGVDENVHAPTRRPPRRVSNEDLPELRETMKPEGTPEGKRREEPDREDAREKVNERPVRDVNK